MNKIKKLLGSRIKEVRKSKGLTQEQLAEKVGIVPSNISYIEKGRYAPSIVNFEKIVQVLNVEPHELYTFSHLKPIEEIKQEFFSVLEKDEKLLRFFYKFYSIVKEVLYFNIK